MKIVLLSICLLIFENIEHFSVADTNGIMLEMYSKRVDENVDKIYINSSLNFSVSWLKNSTKEFEVVECNNFFKHYDNGAYLDVKHSFLNDSTIAVSYSVYNLHSKKRILFDNSLWRLNKSKKVISIEYK